MLHADVGRDTPAKTPFRTCLLTFIDSDNFLIVNV